MFKSNSRQRNHYIAWALFFHGCHESDEPQIQMWKDYQSWYNGSI